jgi:hypothetical protein
VTRAGVCLRVLVVWGLLIPLAMVIVGPREAGWGDLWRELRDYRRNGESWAALCRGAGVGFVTLPNGRTLWVDLRVAEYVAELERDLGDAQEELATHD